MELSCAKGCFGARSNTQLVEDVAHMDLHGNRADEEALADFAVRHTVRH